MFFSNKLNLDSALMNQYQQLLRLLPSLIWTNASGLQSPGTAEQALLFTGCRKWPLPIPSCSVLIECAIHSKVCGSNRGSTSPCQLAPQGPSPCHSVTSPHSPHTASLLGVLLSGNGLRSIHPSFPRSLKCCSLQKLQRLKNTKVPACFSLLNSNTHSLFLLKGSVLWSQESYSKPQKSLFAFTGRWWGRLVSATAVCFSPLVWWQGKLHAFKVMFS